MGAAISAAGALLSIADDRKEVADKRLKLTPPNAVPGSGGASPRGKQLGKPKFGNEDGDNQKGAIVAGGKGGQAARPGDAAAKKQGKSKANAAQSKPEDANDVKPQEVSAGKAFVIDET